MNSSIELNYLNRIAQLINENERLFRENERLEKEKLERDASSEEE